MMETEAVGQDEHVMVKLGGLQNKAWAMDTSKFGYKMLEKMGWKAGQGVGKNLQGQASHVKIVKRSEGLGIGCSLKQAEVTGWSSTSSSFADVLAKLNQSYANKSASSSDDSETDKDKKAKKSKKEKKEKKEKKAKKEKKEKKEVLSRRILYAKRIKNKNAKAYDAKEMAAILGDAVNAYESKENSSDNQSVEDVNVNDVDVSSDEERKRKKARKEAKKAKKAKRTENED